MMTEKITLLTLLWILYFFIHSFLATKTVKKIMISLLGENARFYRLGYNVIAVIGFGSILYYQYQLAPVYIFSTTDMSFLIGAILIILGIGTGGFAFLNYRWQEFVGLDQLKANQTIATPGLVTSGLNRYVRHPLYFAAILILTGNFMLEFKLQTLSFTIVSLVYLVVGTLLEEKKLIAEYGDAYRDYRKQVKMLIPYIF
jgi:protein-S-isoprenylcysteine O-methyltransferase Ste14